MSESMSRCSEISDARGIINDVPTSLYSAVFETGSTEYADVSR